MDTAYISALSALAGSIIGGVMSLATSWLNQNTQSRSQTLTQEIAKREALYGKFIDEASRLMADAMGHEREAADDIVVLHALVNRMRLTSSSAVIKQAQAAVLQVIDAYLAPNRSLRDLRQTIAEDKEADVLRGFSEACRAELRALMAARRLQQS